MFKNLALLACTVAAALATTTVLARDYRHDDRHRDQPRHERAGHDLRPFEVGLWGDQFYADDPAEKARMARQTIDSMNHHHLAFTLYAGDTKNGHSQCTDSAIGQDVLDRFNALRAPTLYSLGDNEWTDCHRTSNGSYDPLERLSYLRQVFFSRNESQGRHPLKVTRQGPLGGVYSENSRFVHNNVEFVAVHVPGSNNNLVANDDECFHKSNRTQADCNAATAEYEARNRADVEWLKDAFTEARDNDYAGIAIVIQADIYFPFELSDGGYAEDFLPQLDESNGFSDFFHTLVKETQSFDGQVLLVHGDSHYFKVDKAMYDPDGRLTPNFTRVEVFGESDNSWIDMIVDPSDPNVFTFRPVVLK